MADMTPELAHEEPEVIRQQIEETRGSITEKLEALENQVVGTVQSARETVEETLEAVKSSVETVKSSVEETVESVKETFDLKRQVQRHPWPMVGGSLLAGLAVGVFLNRVERRSVAPHSRPQLLEPENGRRFATARESSSESVAPRDGLFREELDKIKGIAVGYALGLARDWIKEAVPQLAPQIDDLAQSVTTKLGGQPIAGPVLPSREHSQYEHPY